MIVNVSVIKTWVQQYLADIISKQELSKKANETMYLLLKGDLYEFENISLYRIVSILAQVDDYDSCAREDILQIKNILDGQEDAYYTIHMKITPEYQDKEVQKIRNNFIKYREKCHLSKTEIEDILFFINKKKQKVSTIIDLLCAEIAAFLSSGYFFYPDDEEMRFGFCSTLFVEDEEEREDKYLEKLFYLLDCSCGINTFCVLICYRKGEPNVVLI